jgi:SAM-dependent methyltransferase
MEEPIVVGHDVKRLVEAGYDKIAQQYLAWTKKGDSPRVRYLQPILDRLPAESAKVLDLGCGAGIPCAQILSLHAHVTGVDISAAQIALAQQHVPEATFLQADMMAVDFPPDSFDAVAALYSVIHLPRIEQGVLLSRVARWLRPHGQLLVNVGVSDDPGFIDPEWLGAPMYWSSYDAQTYLDLIRRAGFSVRSADHVSEDEDGQTVVFFWIRAEKNYSPRLRAVRQ